MGDDRLPAEGRAVVEESNHSFASMFGPGSVDVIVSADMRYRGQSHELEIVVGDWSEAGQRFHVAHRERFGFGRPGEPVEVVNVRATVTGTAPLSWADLPPPPREVEPVGRQAVWGRATLPVGFSLEGPAIVVEDNSATLLEAGDRLSVLDDGTLLIAV